MKLPNLPLTIEMLYSLPPERLSHIAKESALTSLMTVSPPLAFSASIFAPFITVAPPFIDSASIFAPSITAFPPSIDSSPI